MKNSKWHFPAALPRYQYKPLSGDHIRLINLQPVVFEHELEAEIAHCPFGKAPAESKPDLLSTAEIDNTLPTWWKSFRTQEGRLLYDNIEGGWASQWHRPLFASLSDQLREILQSESCLVEYETTPDGDLHFEARSYAWGDPTPQDSLRIKESLNAGPNSQIPVTRNLSSALRHLRHRESVRVIWADAICINQKHLAERNAQVSRIADIFTSAWRVVVWLGEEGYGSKSAMDALQYLGQQTEISQQNWIHAAPDGETPHWADRSFELPYSDAQWASMNLLFTRPWFYRLWVLQEIGLAISNKAIVQCCYDVITYYNMRRAIVAFHLRSGAPQSLLEKIYRLVEMSHGATNLSLVYLIAIA